MKQTKQKKTDYAPLGWAIALFLVIFVIGLILKVGSELLNFLTKTF